VIRRQCGRAIRAAFLRAVGFIARSLCVRFFSIVARIPYFFISMPVLFLAPELETAVSRPSRFLSAALLPPRNGSSDGPISGNSSDRLIARLGSSFVPSGLPWCQAVFQVGRTRHSRRTLGPNMVDASWKQFQGLADAARSWG